MKALKIYAPSGNLIHTRRHTNKERFLGIAEIHLNSLESIGEPHTQPTYKDKEGNIVEWKN